MPAIAGAKRAVHSLTPRAAMLKLVRMSEGVRSDRSPLYNVMARFTVIISSPQKLHSPRRKKRSPAARSVIAPSNTH